MPSILKHEPAQRLQARGCLHVAGFILLLFVTVGIDSLYFLPVAALLFALGVVAACRTLRRFTQAAAHCPRCGEPIAFAGYSTKRLELHLCRGCDVLWDVGIRESVEDNA